MIDEAVYDALMALDLDLARYGGVPAVFYQQAPPENDPKWRGAKYPRITFVFKYAGRDAELTVKTWCQVGGAVAPEDMERAVRDGLNNGLLLRDNGERCIVIWRSSEPFEDSGNPPNLHVAGYILKFEVRELTCYARSCALPIRAISGWTARNYPAAFVIGEGEDERAFREYAGPVMHWKVGKLARDKQMHGCVWLAAELRLAVYGDAQDAYLSIMEKLLREGFIWMGDDSPIHFDSARIDGDELIVNARFGIYPEIESGEVLYRVHVEYGKGA